MDIMIFSHCHRFESGPSCVCFVVKALLVIKNEVS